MTFSEMFTYSSIAFILLLISIYYSKSIFNNTRTKIYKLMLILTVFFIIAEIITVFYIKYANASNSTIEMILLRLHWEIGIVWYALFFFYCLSMIKNYNDKSIFEMIKVDLFSKIILAMFTIVAVVYPFLKYTGLLETNELEYTRSFSYLPGTPAIVLVAFTIVMFIIIVVLMYSKKYYNNTTKDEKYTIVVALLILFGTIILQMFILHISFIPLGIVLFEYSLYFNLENPDLSIMNEISNAQGDIEKSNQTKTDFLSNMTYEIKVPMNLISSLCDELVNMSVFDEKIVKEDIEQIQQSGNNLLDIINNVLDISKIESGKSTLQEREYAINDVITNVINISKSKIGAKPVKLEVNIDQNISSVLYGDSAKLYQSLLNLMGNAVKYTDVGRITFTLSSTKSSGVEHLLFKISDTGTGIKEEDQSKMFSKFTRLNNAVENEIEGSGLGLVITKEYVESMGGRIWFETQYRVGSTFYIEVPQKIVDATTLGASVASVKTQTPGEKLDCSNYTALIVDDNNLNIKVAKRLLEGYKFKIDSVTAGKDCVYKIKEGTHFDIIFMDHMMPEMDGIETLHVLKKLDGYELPPIIALTANAITGMKEMYLNEGFDDYLSKPINTNELDRIINRFFNK